MENNLLVMFLTAFTLGLVGSGHCLGMCGGIVVSLDTTVSSDASASIGPRMWSHIVFNIGRISSYGVIGLLAAGSVGVAAAMTPYGLVLRVLAALMTIAIGLSIADWWRGIGKLEVLGAVVWRHIQPLTQRFLPPQTLMQVLILGLLWGWLPCGLVYTALSYALVAGTAVKGLLVMLAFGLGTLPAMLFVGTVSQTLRQKLTSPWGRRCIGLMVVLMGVYMLNSALFSEHKHHSELPSAGLDHSQHQH